MGRFGELNCHQQFDSRGRLLNQKVRVKDSLNKPIERHYQYNVASELTQMTDNYKGVKTFTHDLKSRLSSASHQPYSQGQLPDELSYKGYHEHFYFDGADNLLGSEKPLDELKHASSTAKTHGTPQAPCPHSNELKANRLLIQGDRHYQYDQYGNVIRELRGKRQHTEHQFKWNGQHQLIEFKKIRHYWDENDKDFHQTVETVHCYEYDAFGRRISKTDMQTGDKTLFFWQGENLITECHADDADFSVEVIRNEHTKAQDYRCISYIYEPGSTGFRPMAQLVGRGRGGQIYYYLNDQLGTPQELITANGDIVWSGVYKSYGNLAIEYRTVPQNLRFQGQYFDEDKFVWNKFEQCFSIGPERVSIRMIRIIRVTL
ncbi:hypothetical protein A9G41_11910 [Gilliamella sp. Nev5-1]|uniref:RHS repeat domain-containing protein n=1 Tax=Gilliamella sp. Nev5-1 TaxID=3120251 RepID=UPI0008290762|nr:RHS domain-containing protein [Gilliamella apicola]OCG66919.1 hypothetical protein A9G41_11910 [Gilliamella apicola]